MRNLLYSSHDALFCPNKPKHFIYHEILTFLYVLQDALFVYTDESSLLEMHLK